MKKQSFLAVVVLIMLATVGCGVSETYFTKLPPKPAPTPTPAPATVR